MRHCQWTVILHDTVYLYTSSHYRTSHADCCRSTTWISSTVNCPTETTSAYRPVSPRPREVRAVLLPRADLRLTTCSHAAMKSASCRAYRLA
eukprot:6200875-Pleurochrysis_carterae.AAC.1